jgi:hypothetical protein
MWPRGPFTVKIVTGKCRLDNPISTLRHTRFGDRDWVSGDLAYDLRIHSLLALCLILLSVSSCSITPYSSTRPENYKGPVAERPGVQKGDYWIYQRGDLAKIKSTSPPSNIEFPLWIGKKWSYGGFAVRSGQSSTNPFRVSTTNDCYVVAYKQVTVAAGTLWAFECECECNLIAGALYEPGCGQWTTWYAPDVKNIIRTKTESTDRTLELLEYKLTPNKNPS